MSKGSPINVRLDAAENSALAALAARAGLNQSEIIRRAIKLAFRNYRDSGSIAFILDPAHYESALISEPPIIYGGKTKPPAKRNAS